MSVIVNDFEIVTDASGEEAGETGPKSQKADRTPGDVSVRPIDVESVLERDARRRRRLRAH